jgi:hypothetical protein
VVGVDQERGVPGGEQHQGGARHGAALQVEGAQPLGEQQGAEDALAVGLGQAAEVRHRDGEAAGGEDHLHRLALRLGEHGAQRLVPPHQAAYGPDHGGRVQRAVQAVEGGDVVGRAAGLHPVQEPEPPLREGQGERPVRGAPADLRRGGARPAAGLFLEQALQQEPPRGGKALQGARSSAHRRSSRGAPGPRRRRCTSSAERAASFAISSALAQ